jgi:DNA-binding NtrC family response regulator
MNQTVLFKRDAILIEQNLLQHKLYGDILAVNGFEVHVAETAIDGLMKIRENKYDITVINAEIAEETFVEKLIAKIQSNEKSKHMPIVGISIYSEERKKNISKIVDAFLTKPFSIDRFIGCVYKSIEKKNNGCESTYNQ